MYKMGDVVIVNDGTISNKIGTICGYKDTDYRQYIVGFETPINGYTHQIISEYYIREYKELNVTLEYYKASGKYYSGGSYNTRENDDKRILNEIREMNTHPGVSTKWSNGFIRVIIEDSETYIMNMTEYFDED